MQVMKRVAVSVRPELERVAPYVAGETLDAFSARVGIPVERLVKLNSNESPYPPSPRVQAREPLRLRPPRQAPLLRFARFPLEAEK